MYKSQIPVIEQAIETAARMLGSDKSRGYCLAMICADFLAGAHMDNGDSRDPAELDFTLLRFLPEAQKREFLSAVNGRVGDEGSGRKSATALPTTAIFAHSVLMESSQPQIRTCLLPDRY